MASAGAAEPAMSWVAVIHYRFSTEPLSAEDRFINPLGFQVTRYHRSPEALPQPSAVPPSAPASSGPDATPAAAIVVEPVP